MQLESLKRWIPAAAAAAIPLLTLAVMPRAGHAGEPMPDFTRERASGFARLALKGLGKEYPNKPEHVMAGPADVKGPKALHPAFYGAYDWHSCVHGHWMLARLLRRFPGLPEAGEIRAVLGANLTAENLEAEAAYFARKESKPFERPYGWAWLLKLTEELHGWDDPDAKAWSTNLRPLADAIVARYLEFFTKQTYPIRTGVHPNTAFGLAFAHEYARAVGDARLKALVEERARAYFGADADAPARWEPSGADFFSPSLAEADLMRRVMPPAEFRAWFAGFLPGTTKEEPESLFVPADIHTFPVRRILGGTTGTGEFAGCVAGKTISAITRVFLKVAPRSMDLERNASQHLRSLHHSPMFLAPDGVVMHSFASKATVVMACSITGLMISDN